MKIFSTRSLLGLASFLCLLVTTAGSAGAAEFPSKPITIVVAGAPAGATDSIARALAADLTRQLGQSVIVDNRSGAGGIIGSKSVVNAAPDGYTLLLGHVSSNAIVPAVVKPRPYDPVGDFSPISLIGTSMSVLVVSPKSGIGSLSELLALGRSRPEGLTYGSPGVGLSQHFAGAALAKATGVPMLHVPYRGSAPALLDVASGQIDMMFVPPGAAAPFLSSGQVRALAVTSGTRSRFFPDTPTMTELGVPQVEQLSWFGLFAPAGTPAPIVDKLSSSVGQSLQNPRTRETLEGLSLELTEDTSPASFDKFVRAEAAKWEADVKNLGMSQE